MLRADIKSLTSGDHDVFHKEKAVLLTIRKDNKEIKEIPGFNENTERVEDVGPEEFYWANREWMEMNGVI